MASLYTTVWRDPHHRAVPRVEVFLVSEYVGRCVGRVDQADDLERVTRLAVDAMPWPPVGLAGRERAEVGAVLVEQSDLKATSPPSLGPDGSTSLAGEGEMRELVEFGSGHVRRESPADGATLLA